MDATQAVILGFIQGVTEFLPVSSSGHLVIFQHFFGLKESNLLFDASVHVGTLISVLIVFWLEIKSILLTFFTKAWQITVQKETFPKAMEDTHFATGMFIIVGSVPTAILGLGFHKIADRLFSSILIVGITLMITGLIIGATKGVSQVQPATKPLSFSKAIIIGVVQGLAIIPGISRSGSTIATALFIGIDREKAGRFSFLLSMPAIFGAELLAMKDVFSGTETFSGLNVVGAIAALISGYIALKAVLYFVKQGRLYIFSPYCLILGCIILGTSLL